MPEHLSCYSLILEEGTPFYSRWKAGDFHPLSADNAADYYELTGEVLSKAGYTAYEISNFSLDEKFRCRHNLKYWNHDTYLGFGPSAHSFHSPVRWKNERSLSKYITLLKNNQLPVHETEKLPEDTLEFEYIFLHLRLKEGLHGGDYQKRFHKNFADQYSNKISRLTDAGMIEQNEGYFRLSQRGWLLADEVASSF
jgi:oxygen-independent coproporphyrinogen-3 oxidase